MELIIGQINLCDVFTNNNILHHTLKGLESNWFILESLKVPLQSEGFHKSPTIQNTSPTYQNV